MSSVFRICTLSVVIGLSACGQSDDHESSSPPPNAHDATQDMVTTPGNEGYPNEPEQQDLAASDCEYSEQLLNTVPDDDAIEGVGWSDTFCTDASAKATYRGEDARYVFSAQVLEGDSPLLGPFIESMTGAPESVVKQLQSAISMNGQLFRAMHGTCKELSGVDYLPPEMPTPVVESGICVMKQDDYWAASKLISQELGLLIEYHGASADALNDSQQAAQKLSALFEKFSVPSR